MRVSDARDPRDPREVQKIVRGNYLITPDEGTNNNYCDPDNGGVRTFPLKAFPNDLESPYFPVKCPVQAYQYSLLYGTN